MRTLRTILVAAVLVAPIAASARANPPEWTEPKDGVMTAKQIDGAIVCMAGIRKNLENMEKEIAAKPDKELSAVELMARGKKFSDANEAAKKASGLEEAELNWATNALTETW